MLSCAELCEIIQINNIQIKNKDYETFYSVFNQNGIKLSV